jgi:PAP2 superfamily
MSRDESTASNTRSTMPAPAPTPYVEPPAADRLTRRLLGAAILAALLAVALYLMLVHTALGQRFDNSALRGAQGQLSQDGRADPFFIRRITADSFAVVLITLVAIGVARRRPRLGIGVALAAALTVITTHLLRTSLLNRPFLIPSDAVNTANTFPSGHTATAITCALALVVVSAPAWRGVSAVLAGSYAALTAAAVQTAGWHRPSDAIGAAFLGFAAITVVAAIIAATRPVGSRRRFSHVPAFITLAVVWAFAGAYSAVNAVRVLRFLSDHAASVTPTSAVLDDAYHFSLGLTIVVVAGLSAALLALLGPYDLDEPGAR